MPFLLDTNCWMQLVRKREHADDVRDFLRAVPPTSVFVTDYAVPPSLFVRIVDANRNHQLDIDDAYHYVSAELHNLTLVSLDTDFDRTPRGRLTPAAALQQYANEQPRQQSQQGLKPPPP